MVNFRDFQQAKQRGEENPFFEKDFDGWGSKKKEVDRTQGVAWQPRNPKEREIWNVFLGHNVGDEVCGKEGYVRPVVVIHRFGSVCLIAPLTTKGKDDMWHQQISATVVVPVSRIKLTNMTTISIKRFIRKIDVLEETEFMQTLSRISALTGIQS